MDMDSTQSKRTAIGSELSQLSPQKMWTRLPEDPEKNMSHVITLLAATKFKKSHDTVDWRVTSEKSQIYALQLLGHRKVCIDSSCIVKVETQQTFMINLA